MSGECKTYRLNEPMSWKEFKEMPNDLKVDYIKAIRNRWNAPDIEIAAMMGICGPTLSAYIEEYGLRQGRNGRKRTWDEEGFRAWCNGKCEEAVESPELTESDTDINPNPDPDPIAFTGHYMPVIPKSGTMTFEYNFTDDALAIIKCLLSNVRANITISWDCVSDEDVYPNE